jgi:hypothetical protein
MKLTEMQANLETYAQRIESLRAKVAQTLGNNDEGKPGQRCEVCTDKNVALSATPKDWQPRPSATPLRASDARPDQPKRRMQQVGGAVHV